MKRVAISLALFAALGAPTYGPADTGVVNVSHSADYSEGEEPLSVNPVDPDQMTTVANVFQASLPPPLDLVFGGGGAQDTRVYSTQDGGRHWRTSKLDQGGIGPLALPLPESEGGSPEFSDAFNVVNTDADSIWDRHGNAYFESGDIHGIHHHGDETATVWRSADGGRTWGPPDGYPAVSAAGEHSELDRPWFAIDNTGGPRDGTLYMTFETSPFVDIPPQVYLKRSTDHGVTWSPTFRVDDGTYETQYNPRARPVVGADGTLYVVYDRSAPATTPFTQQAGPIQLVVARSDDGGETWNRFVADDDVHSINDPDEAVPGYREMIPAIAADPAVPDRVAVTWPEALGDGNSRIVLRVSRSGGAAWSPRIDVADDPVGTPDQHDHVSLAWARGALFAGWRDRRCCGGAFDDRYQQFVRAFVDGTQPGAVIEMTDGSEPGANRNGRSHAQPDEFQGLVATTAGVALTWSRLNGAYDDLMFRRVPLSAFGLGTAPGCSDTRRFSFHLHGLPGQRVVRATLYVDGRARLRRRGRRLTRLTLPRLPVGTFTVRIVAVTQRGDRVISVRRYRGCRKEPPRTHVVHPH